MKDAHAISPWIRPAQEADIPAILVINAAGAPGVSPLSASEWTELARLATLSCVAESDGTILGYLVALAPEVNYTGEEFRWFQQQYARFLYIDQVAVAGSWRGCGVGALLYAHAEAFALSRGSTRLVCEVNLRPPNPESMRFHTRWGFSSVGTLEVSDGRLVSLLVKELGSPQAAL
ncbi:MAG TPA: GNAT family N-acetyltransferase [Longimicrobiaceae bacterium]|nr:GNAT family N-acetyltransferase [Longimicrobiaceae bacterium]